MMRIKLAIAAALKAKRTWDRIPVEQRQKIAEAAAATTKTYGPVVAKKAADTAKTRGPAVAKAVGDTAKTHGPAVAKAVAGTAKAKGPILARKLAESLERALNKPGR